MIKNGNDSLKNLGSKKQEELEDLEIFESRRITRIWEGKAHSENEECYLKDSCMLEFNGRD